MFPSLFFTQTSRRPHPKSEVKFLKYIKASYICTFSKLVAFVLGNKEIINIFFICPIMVKKLYKARWGATYSKTSD